MEIQNTEIANILNKVGDLLEIEGANVFRIKAYHNAAKIIEDLTIPVSKLIEEGFNLALLKGIGEDLEEKVNEIVQTGNLQFLKSLEKELPSDLLKMTMIKRLGPKRIKLLHEKLGISTLEGLEKALQTGEISKLKGMGQKTQQNIRKEIMEIKNKLN